MPPDLIQIQGPPPLVSVTLGDEGELTIGRDDRCAVRVAAPAVSRYHAQLQRAGERHRVRDLDSANGTRLNGLDLGEVPVLLEDGDLIEIGGVVTLRYDCKVSARVKPRPWLAGAALVVGLAAALFWLTDLGLRDAELERAIELAEEGHRAAQARDPVTAKRRLRSAAGILFRRGELDDVPGTEMLRVAMERLSLQVEGSPDLWADLEAALAATAPKLPEIAEVAPERGCRLDRVRSVDVDPCLRERIELVLLALHQDPAAIPSDFHQQVGRRIVHEYDLLDSYLPRAEKLRPMLEAELEREHMPAMLHYLAFVESLYDPDAVSPAGAAGLWQFMPGTARQFGLVVSRKTDERRDPVKATRAAARYLRDLAFEFDGRALLLTLASYNRGQNAVRRALKKLDDPFRERSYWRLVEKGLLPVETSRYVTRFMAAAVAGEAGMPSREVLSNAGY